MDDKLRATEHQHPGQVVALMVRRCMAQHGGMAHGNYELLCPTCRDAVATLLVGVGDRWGGWWPCACTIAITLPAKGGPQPGGRAFTGWAHLHPPGDSHCPTCDAKRPGWAAPPETPKARAVYAWTCQCKEPGTTRPWMHKASETSCAMCKVASPYMTDAYLEQLGVDPRIRPDALGLDSAAASEDGGD